MNSGKDLIDELKKRGFTEKMYFELGNSLIKEYKGREYHYSIIFSFKGNVYLTNYDENNSGTFCLNLDKEFTEDLLFIVPFVIKDKE